MRRQATLKMTGVDHVVLHVRDMAKSRKFYLDILGMTVEHETSWQTFLLCSNQGIHLFEMRNGKDFEVGELNHIALQTDHGTYKSITAELGKHGIEVTGRPADDNCVYFHDPDGHRLQILFPGSE